MVKANPCRNILEQRWEIEKQGERHYFVSQKLLPNGGKVCIATDASKVNLLPNAVFTKVEPCRPIPELAHWVPHHGNAIYQFKVEKRRGDGAELCLGVDGTKIGVIENANRVVAHPCQNIPEMRFNAKMIGNLWSGSQAPTPNPSNPVQPPITQPPLQSNTYWEVLMVARRRENNVPWTNDTGHAFIGLVKKVGNGNFEAVRTFSYWPGSEVSYGNSQIDRFKPNSSTSLTINYSTNVQHLIDITQGNGHELSNRGHAVRKSRISNSRASWIMNNLSKEIQCNKYGFYSRQVNSQSGDCNCLDYTTSLWYELSSKWEDFRLYSRLGVFPGELRTIGALTYSLWPDSLVGIIDYQNQKTGSEYLDNGQIWQ